MIKKWLEEYGKEIEKMTTEKLHCYIGTYVGKYYDGEDKYIQINGKLFFTPNSGNLFTVYDKEQNITDYFDVFEDNATITINEDFFTYIFPKNNEEVYKISIKQIKADIKTLQYRFVQLSGIWEQYDGDECSFISEEELMLCKAISNRYPFKYNYKPSNFNKNPNDLNEDWSNIKFDTTDFDYNNINDDNYIKVEAVAFDFKTDFVAMLKALQKELKWFPPRFRQEFIEIICQSPQTAKSIRKNAEDFSESILDELAKEEKNRMFVRL